MYLPANDVQYVLIDTRTGLFLKNLYVHFVAEFTDILPMAKQFSKPRYALEWKNKVCKHNKCKLKVAVMTLSFTKFVEKKGKKK